MFDLLSVCCNLAEFIDMVCADEKLPIEIEISGAFKVQARQ